MVSKDLPTERERLRLLEQDSDSQTMEILQGLPVTASWRCLDLGAGAGSIAYWLADRCRDGHVVAADIDIRFLDRAWPDNLEVRQFDVGRDGFPAGPSISSMPGPCCVMFRPGTQSWPRPWSGWPRRVGWWWGNRTCSHRRGRRIRRYDVSTVRWMSGGELKARICAGLAGSRA
jgi:SAM-dependent methyltransferase